MRKATEYRQAKIVKSGNTAPYWGRFVVTLPGGQVFDTATFKEAKQSIDQIIAERKS